MGISTQSRDHVEGVEAIEGIASKPKYEWKMESGLDANFRAVGKLLASMLDLYQRPEGGLLLVEGAQARAIESAKELAPLLIDTLRISVTKNGKYSAEKPSDSVLNNMLRSRSFLANFQIGPRGGDDPGRPARLDALLAGLQPAERNSLPRFTGHDRTRCRDDRQVPRRDGVGWRRRPHQRRRGAPHRAVPPQIPRREALRLDHG